MTALILCFAVIFSSTVIPASAYAQPDKVGDKVTVRFPLVNFRRNPNFSLSSIKTIFWIGREVKVLGYKGFFTYVKDVETNENGYIFSNFLTDNEEGTLSVSERDFSAYVGAKRISIIEIKYNGNKNVNWNLSKNGIVEVTEESDGNLSIKGISPGSVTLTIRAGLESETRTLNCIYKWQKVWTGKANKKTTVYKGAGTEYESWVDISEGQKFIVYGDDGSSDGWAYGNVDGTNTWGFVKINNISTKGTVSQYNNMNWTYPIKNTKFKNISSVYGWRNNSRHLGFDINKTPYTTIQGEEAVSICSGKVVFVNKTYNYSTEKPDYGYCVIIESDVEDPISGNKLRIVYMHLNEPPNLSLGNELTPGQKIGFIGTTGRSTGPHLHLEINNKGTNFAGSGNSDSFNKTINPIFFYMNSGLKDNSDSTYKEYWYNDNK